MTEATGQKGFDIDYMMKTMGEKVGEAEQNLQEKVANADPTDISDMLDFQRIMMQFQMHTETYSNLLKSIRDLHRGIMQKIN